MSYVQRHYTVYAAGKHRCQFIFMNMSHNITFGAKGHELKDGVTVNALERCCAYLVSKQKGAFTRTVILKKSDFSELQNLGSISGELIKEKKPSWQG